MNTMEERAPITYEVCQLLKEDGLPVRFDQRTSTCTISKSGGIEITLSGDDLIVRNKGRDTVFIFPRPKEAVSEFDLFHGENVVRVKGPVGELEFRVPTVGSKTLRVVVSFDVDKDDNPDAGAIRLWK